MEKKEKPNKLDAKKLPGVSLELAVANIQKMMDTNSTVSHNEKLEDRVGNIRQYDVVIRGQFGGRQVLGVIECKDHNRKKGPSTIEAFSKKTENLGVNLRLIVSRKGFTKQALKLAKHEDIGCLSLLPDNPEQVGFSIGDMWYGVFKEWSNIRLKLHSKTKDHIPTFNANTIKFQGKAVKNWFIKELLTTYSNEEKEGTYYWEVKFKKPINIESKDRKYPLIAITFRADREYKIKKKWVCWSGDALFDWNENKFTIPAKGQIFGSAIETDLKKWDNFNGELPKLKKGSSSIGLMRAIFYSHQEWDKSEDNNVPDLKSLGNWQIYLPTMQYTGLAKTKDTIPI